MPRKRNEELWTKRFNNVWTFVSEHKRRPSKHRLEEHAMLNWIKYNKKQAARGLLTSERAEKLDKLMLLLRKYQRINQYSYTKTDQQSGNLQLSLSFNNDD